MDEMNDFLLNAVTNDEMVVIIDDDENENNDQFLDDQQDWVNFITESFEQ